MSYAPRSDGPKKGPEISESTGPVASDSLAAESIRNDGGFADNANPDILGVKGGQSTLANTDTSGADVLPAASSSAERGDEEEVQLGGSGTGTGVDITSSSDDDTTPKVISSSSGNVQTGSTDGPTPTTGSRPYVDTAPTYTSSTTGSLRTEGELQPKGKNLTEGGDIPENVKTFTGNVGGEKDPGREAERKMLAENADSAAGVVRDRGEVGGDGDGNPYEALRSSDRA